VISVSDTNRRGVSVGVPQLCTAAGIKHIYLPI